MFKNQLVFAVKQNCKSLKEFGDQVHMKFGSEYSIFLKNLSNLDSILHITIDGDNITRDGLVVRKNSIVNLERFFSSQNKFRFLERTAKIEEHSGISYEDGLISLSFQFEKKLIITQDMIMTLLTELKDDYNVNGSLIEAKNALIHSKGYINGAIKHVLKHNWGYQGTKSLDKLTRFSSFKRSVPRELRGNYVGVTGFGATGFGSTVDQIFTTVDGFELDGIINKMTIQIKGNHNNSIMYSDKIQCDKCGKCVNKETINKVPCSVCGNHFPVK